MRQNIRTLCIATAANRPCVAERVDSRWTPHARAPLRCQPASCPRLTERARLDRFLLHRPRQDQRQGLCLTVPRPQRQRASGARRPCRTTARLAVEAWPQAARLRGRHCHLHLRLPLRRLLLLVRLGSLWQLRLNHCLLRLGPHLAQQAPPEPLLTLRARPLSGLRRRWPTLLVRPCLPASSLGRSPRLVPGVRLCRGDLRKRMVLLWWNLQRLLAHQLWSL